jgi:hypothetical protein
MISKSILALNKLSTVQMSESDQDSKAIVETAFYSRSIGDLSIFNHLKSNPGNEVLAPLEQASWDPPPYTFPRKHIYGFVDPNNPQIISDARTIPPDSSILGKQLSIKLHKFYVFCYPGAGEHYLLVKYEISNPTAVGTETATFFQYKNGTDNDFLKPTPVFINFSIGSQLPNFDCQIINIYNNSNRRFLNSIDYQEIDKGLKLSISPNPLIPMLNKVTNGLVSAMQNPQNKPIQEISLELDLSNDISTVKLKEGMYVAVQVTDTDNWNWNLYMFDGNSVVKKIGKTTIPNNFAIFSVTK